MRPPACPLAIRKRRPHLTRTSFRRTCVRGIVVAGPHCGDDRDRTARPTWAVASFCRSAGGTAGIAHSGGASGHAGWRARGRRPDPWSRGTAGGGFGIGARRSRLVCRRPAAGSPRAAAAVQDFAVAGHVREAERIHICPLWHRYAGDREVRARAVDAGATAGRCARHEAFSLHAVQHAGGRAVGRRGTGARSAVRGPDRCSPGCSGRHGRPCRAAGGCAARALHRVALA